MENHIKLNLKHENIILKQVSTESNNSDKYQYILPYHNYDSFRKTTLDVR